jgi:putative spermidine/putrescine transport system permease protein
MRFKIPVIVFLVLAVLPLAAGLGYAFLYSIGLTGAVSKGFTVLHWQVVLTDPNVWGALALSLGMAVLVLVMSAVLALCTALVLREPLEGRWAFLPYLPLTMPPLVAAFWVFQLLSRGGWLSRLMGFERPEAFPELVNDAGHVGVLLALVMLTFPFLTLLFLAQARAAGLPALMQAAQTLGASSRQAVWRVAVPVLLFRTRPALMLYGLFLVGAYEVPLLLGRQSPRMLSVLIAQKFRRFDLLELPQAYVLTCLYAIIVVFILKKWPT